METLAEREPVPHTFALMRAFDAMRWSVSNQEFSALLKPIECEALLDHIERLEEEIRDLGTS